MTTSNSRESQFPIEAMFLDRWSPRAFTGETISEEQLLTILDAAHWAPSSANQQPWRFIYALKGSEHFETALGLLAEANQEWAKNASALLFVVSRGFSGDFSEGKKSYTHSFDAGAAWGHFAMQARFSGFYAHGMGGIKHERFATRSPFRKATAWRRELPSGALQTRAYCRSVTKSASFPASESRSPKSRSRENL